MKDDINFDDLKPRGVDKIPHKKLKENNFQSLNKMETVMENKYGIDNTVATIGFLETLGNGVADALEDDKKISWTEGFSIGSSLIFKVSPFIKALPHIPDELGDDITPEEETKLANALTKIKLVGDQKKEFVKDVLQLANSIKTFVFKYFIKK